MADLERTISIIFGAVDDISGPLGSMAGKLDSFALAVEDLAAPWAKVADAVIKVDLALVALAAGGAAYSILKFAEFEDTMLKVKGILGASEDEYKSLTDVTRELGATTRYTATEAAQGLEFLALAGFSATDAMDALPAVLQLAQASAIGLGDAADIVTNIMSGYGIEVKNLKAANDVLTATFTNSNTNLEQLGHAFKYVGPVAKTLGLEIEETASILGILGNAGYQAEMGGTALRNILVALVAPSGNMSKLMKDLGVDTNEFGIDLSSSANALKSLGVEVKDSEGNLKPFVDIMDQMKAGLDKIPDSADRTAVLMEIFGKRGGPQMAALLEQGSGAVLALETKIKSLSGVTESIADQMESGMGGALRKMKSAFEAVSLSIGENLAEALKKATAGVIAINTSFGGIVDSGTFDLIFEFIQSFADELGQTLQTIAKNLPEAFKYVNFGDLLDAIWDVADSLESLFDGVDLTTPEGLQEVLQFLVDSLASLAYVTAGMVDFFKPVIISMTGGVKSFNDMDTASKKMFGELLGLAKSIVDLGAYMSVAIAWIGSAADKLAGPFEVVINTVSGTWDATVAVWSAAKLAFLNILDDLLAASQLFSNTFLFGAFGDDITANRAALAGMISDIEVDLISATESAIQKLTGIKVDIDSSDTYTTIADIGKISDAVLEVPDDAIVVFDAEVDEFQKDITVVDNSLLAIADEITVSLAVAADLTEAKTAKNYLSWFDETGTEHVIDLDVDSNNLTAAEQQIEEIPSEKTLEITLQGEIDTQIAAIEAQAATAQAAFQYKAAVDIAEAEAQADILVAAFEAAGQSVEALADATSDMFGGLLDNWNDLSSYDQFEFKRLVEKQQELQEQALESQLELNAAQIAYMAAKTNAMNQGDALITINGDGLAPHLEAFMWEILSAVQVRVNEEGLGMLTGV